MIEKWILRVLVTLWIIGPPDPLELVRDTDFFDVGPQDQVLSGLSFLIFRFWTDRFRSLDLWVIVECTIWSRVRNLMNCCTPMCANFSYILMCHLLYFFDLLSSLKRPIFPLLPLVVQMAICFKLAIVGSSIKTSKIRFLSLSSFVWMSTVKIPEKKFLKNFWKFLS